MTGKIWKDKHGRTVLYQRPNLPIIIWAAMSLVAIFVTARPISDVARIIATAALVIWCLLEIFSGVNYLRRVLGLGVLLVTVAAIFKIGL